MSKITTRRQAAPDLTAIRESNREVDRLLTELETPLDRLLRYHRGKLHLLAFLMAVVCALPRFPEVLLGLPVIIIGLAIRTWAAGYLAKNTELCTAGPYAYCRHPMYLANIIIVIGILVAANNFYVTVIALVIAIATYGFSIRREEVLLHRIFGQDYARYCSHTPCLLPRPIRSPGLPATGQFMWSLAWYNGIGEQMGGVLLLVFLFAIKAIVLTHFGYVYPVTYGLWPPLLG